MNIKPIIKVLSVSGICMIILGLILIVLDSSNQRRCYNLPLNEFYNDNSCVNYFDDFKNISKKK